MNKLNLFSKLVIAGAVTATGITLVTPQKAEAGNVYGVSGLQLEAEILLNDNAINFFDAAGETNATLEVSPGGGTSGDFSPFNGDGIADPSQIYIDNSGVDPTPPIGENIFVGRAGSFVGNPPIPVAGPIGADFTRADSYACDAALRGDCLDFFGDFSNNIIAGNVAELYITNPTSSLEDGIAEGDWDLASSPIVIEEGDPGALTISVEYLYELATGVTGFESGNLKTVEGDVEWLLEVINTADDSVVGSLGDSANVVTNALNDTDIDPDSRTRQNQTLNLTLAPGIYQIGIVGEERVTGSARQGVPIPEPASIFGLLTVGGLGLGLKKKKQ